MKPYAELSKTELEELLVQLKAEYKKMQAKDLRLDMSRGKPSQALSNLISLWD